MVVNFKRSIVDVYFSCELRGEEGTGSCAPPFKIFFSPNQTFLFKCKSQVRIG